MDHEKFQRARRYCTSMLSTGLFDWRGQEYQLRNLPQQDRAKSTTARSIPDDNSDYMRHDIVSDHSQSSNNSGSLSNYTNSTADHRLSMQESVEAHMDHRSPRSEPFTPTNEEIRNGSDVKEVEESEESEEDDDELMVPVSNPASLLLASDL